MEQEESKTVDTEIETSAYEDYLERYGLKPSDDGNYVNKEELYKHLCDYVKKREEYLVEFKKVFEKEQEKAKKEGKEISLNDKEWKDKWLAFKPQIDDYIAVAIMKIATHLSYRPNFNGYTYRSEFIGDAIENCIRYIDNFDPNKSSNPFAYITQVCWYSFIRRIVLEKNQSEVKGKLMMSNLSEEFMSMVDEDSNNLNIDETIRNTHAFVELAHKRDEKEKEEALERARLREEKRKKKQRKNSLNFLFKK